MEAKLKPCPFCGGGVQLVHSLKEWVMCINSDCYLNSVRWGGGNSEHLRRVIAAWNTRVNEGNNEQDG